MDELNLTVIKSQLGVTKQALDQYRRLRGSTVDGYDQVEALHDAVRALHVGLDSLVSQFEKLN